MTTATDGAPRLEPGCDRCHARPARPLTPAQERVARLLARGRSYAQIGAVLHMSPRTVESHVTAIARTLPSDEMAPRDRVLVWAYWEYRGRAA